MEKSIYSREQRRLADLLRQVRLAVNLRQEDLASKLEKPQSFVSKYESGERTLDLLELKQVCQALGIDLLDFVKRFEEGNQ
jgi:transcriptional regulator with XRE-family HTH domain